MKPSTVAVVLAAALALTIPNRAAVVVESGDVIGGWQISFPEEIALFADVGIDGVVQGDTLSLEKLANFTDSAEDLVVEGLQIIFSQVEDDAVPFIQISEEAVINQTGLPWIAFQFSLTDTGVAEGDVEFTESFTNISPFTNTDFSADFIELNGGQVGDGQTEFFGVADEEGDGGNLVIATNPTSAADRVISFKEQPIPIPLPPAAWMGLVGLIGAGALSRRGKVA